MELHDTPFNNVFRMVKETFRVRDKEFEQIIRFGNDELRKEEKRKVHKPERWENILYKEDLGTDVMRKVRSLRKITLKDQCLNEKAAQEFSRYCDILSKGIYDLKNESNETLDTNSNQIQGFKQDVEKFITENKEKVINQFKPRTEVDKVSAKTIVVVNKFNEIIYDFLTDAGVVTLEEWDSIEENEDYDKFVVIGKEETFYFKWEYAEMSYKIIDFPVEGKVYFLSIGSNEELEIEYFFSMNDALSYLLDQINEKGNISPDGFGKTYTRKREYLDGKVDIVEHPYDTLSTFSQKVNNLLTT